MDRSFTGMRDKSMQGSPAWISSNKRNSVMNMMRNRTPTGGSSRMSMSGRSSQSVQMIVRTRCHVAENFGIELPVLVREALIGADRSTAVSAHISPDGWAWLVCGRRLLIWQYKQSLDKRGHPRNQCRELTLPPSELAHRADLVWVYTPEGSQVPACIAVSPEGTVRYWPSVAYEGTSVEDTTDLQGQECDSLTSIAPLGCILATTTSTIVLLQPQVSGGRHCVACHMLKPPQSLLGGIGRRMSSLIFGSLPSGGAAEAKLVRVITQSQGSRDQPEFIVYVLTEHTLQKWCVVPHDIERLIYECEVGRRIREAFQGTVWDSMGVSPDEQECWLLDMQATHDGDGVAILAASVNQQVTPDMQFAIATLSTDTAVPPTRLKSFTPLKNAAIPRTVEHDLSQFQLLMTRNSALVYSHRKVLVFSVSNLSEDPDTIDFPSHDRLLGGAVCTNRPVFFSRAHGLVSISPLDSLADDFMNSSIMSHNDSIAYGDVTMSEVGNVSVSDKDLEELTTHQDGDARMKAAFLYHVSKNEAQCKALVQELFPQTEVPYSDIDSPLDVAAVKVSRDLVDDIPAKDPRWSERRTTNVSLSSSTSVEILRQLEQKQRALELFFSFLVDLKLWRRLSAVMSFGVVMATTHVLAEQAEKLVAAIALHQLQRKHGNIIQDAIKAVVAQDRTKPAGKLTAQDLFYREVTGIHRSIQMMVKWSEDQVHSERAPSEVARVLAEVNSVILSVVTEVIQYRQQKAEVFKPTVQLEPGVCEYLPWTAAAGPGGLREALLKQKNLTLKHGARSTGDIKLRTELYDQVVNFVDIILDGRKCHLESVRDSDKWNVLCEQYEEERSSLIHPFVDDQEYERATILAEKYCDFQILVRICDRTGNKERIELYMEKFANEGFSQILFNWYIQEQKPGRLLETFRAGGGESAAAQSAAQQAALARFLGDHPSLSWLQHVFLHDFRRAANTLCGLAREETELLRRKKSMLSLAKLALLAAGDPACGDNGEGDRPSQRIEWLDRELDLVAHQEVLPESVLLAKAYDLDQMCVLTPTDLIQLFISDENEAANEYTFKKALDLLDYIEDEYEKAELRHKIWCQAILRDSWTDADTDVPLNIVQKTIFYKLVALIEFMDINEVDIRDAIPPRESLIGAEELSALPDQQSFQYLLTLAYEHFERVLN